MLKYLLLGVVQGLTEFFPVSSSAHLVILQKLLGISEGTLAITIILHLGTVLSLIVFFFKDILKAFRDKKLLAQIIIVTIITGAIGILGKKFFEEAFSSIALVGAALIITGIILILTKKFMDGKRNNLSYKDALVLGATQAVAIIPGISRSGTTISTLLFRGLDKETSFRFSFLASIPAILGAAILEARKIDFTLRVNELNLIVGFVFSFISGIFALWVLRQILNKAKLFYFGYYCIAVGLVTLLFLK